MQLFGRQDLLAVRMFRSHKGFSLFTKCIFLARLYMHYDIVNSDLCGEQMKGLVSASAGNKG